MSCRTQRGNFIRLSVCLPLGWLRLSRGRLKRPLGSSPIPTEFTNTHSVNRKHYFRCVWLRNIVVFYAEDTVQESSIGIHVLAIFSWVLSRKRASTSQFKASTNQRLDRDWIENLPRQSESVKAKPALEQLIKRRSFFWKANHSTDFLKENGWDWDFLPDGPYA